MSNRLRKFLSSVPVIAAVGLLALYSAVGFFALPAIVKWQIEKQVAEKLGHRLTVKEVRFNPLVFRLEAGDLALSDPQGGPMLSFKRLLVDFELRSLIDRAWTFADVRLEAPVLRFDLDRDGRHNFTALLDRLRDSEPRKESALPRFVVKRVALTDGRIAFSDRLLDKPLVTQIEPLTIEIDHLSTVPAQAARYRLSAHTIAGETLDASGDLTLNPVAAKGTLTLKDFKVTTLAGGLARWVTLDSPAGTIGFASKFDLAVDRDGAISGAAQDIDFNVAALSVNAAGAHAPLLAIETLALKRGRVDLARREVTLAGLRIAKGSLTAAVDEQGRTGWSRLVRVPAAAAQETAAPAQSDPGTTLPGPWRIAVASAEVSQIAVAYSDAGRQISANVAAVGFGAAATAEISPAGARIGIDMPNLSITGAKLGSGADTLGVTAAVINAGRVAIGVAAPRFELGIEKPHGTLEDLHMLRGTDGVQLRSASLAGEQLSVAQAGGETRIAGNAAKVSVSGLAARQGSDRVSLREASFEAKAMSASAGGAARGPSGVDARLDDAALKLTGVGVLAQGASSEIGRVAGASFGAKSLVLAFPDSVVDVTGDGLSAAVSDAVVRDPAGATELLRLGSATLSGGALRLRDRVASADKVALANGAAQIQLDAQGKLNWLSLLQGAAESARPTKVSPTPQAPSSVWRLALKSAEFSGFAIGFEDRRKSPAFAVGLKAMRARVAGLDTGSAAPVQLEFRTELASGGQIEAEGNMRLDSGMSDLKIKVAELALAPVQPYLSQFADLQLASGTLSAEGRLRYGDAQSGAGPRLAYAGSIAVERVLLEEIDPRRPFLAWDSIASSDVMLTLAPNVLDIGELRIDRPSARLIIAGDQTVNLMDVLKKPQPREVAPGAHDSAGNNAKAAAAKQRAAQDDPFPVTIARVSVSRGVLEFADLSLRPQFATQMRELKGVITGLGTDPGRRAKLQLDAQVDKYGSARIHGQIALLHPVTFTEIDMVFRNLEMTALSPYVAKFAGYRIASGRLALDLQYRITNGKLQGENKVVLNQVELGEKVDSPGALDLPLELAIALLKDSDGVIDIGLPVSGDLNDPQFDYGAVIGRAIGNLLGGIVTAPFRAIAALFGAGEEKLDSIDFEPGSDALAPPERQKLEAIARALIKRPALRLVVPPAFAAEEDTPALKSLAVRADIVRRIGVKLAPGEDPGPIDTENPRVQRAVEAAFSQRYAPDLLPVLKRRALENAAPAGNASARVGAPRPPAEDSPAASSAAPPAQPARSLPPAFYQTLVERLIDDEPVTATTLAQLAARRGVAIVRELTTAGGVSAARVLLGAPRQAADANDKAVALRMELEVAR